MPLEAYSLGCVAAQAGRFARPLNDPRSALSTFSYGLHLDSRLYAAYLRRVAEKHGVAVAQGRVAGIEREGEAIKAIRLADGKRIEADLLSIARLAYRRPPYEDWSSGSLRSV